MKSHCKYSVVCSNVFARVFAQSLQKGFVSLEEQEHYTQSVT